MRRGICDKNWRGEGSGGLSLESRKLVPTLSLCANKGEREGIEKL